MGTKHTAHTTAHGIAIKKQHGQHFLRDQAIVDRMLHVIEGKGHRQVLEIGCGDGFLTRSLLTLPVDTVRVYEIDPEWAEYVRKTYPDARLQVCTQNVLQVPAQDMVPGPWVMMANLPYVVTFPILQWWVALGAVIPEGVIMVQEEVAQRLAGQSGREYGFVSVYFQHFFDITLLHKVPPTAFVPPPKVTSRFVHLVWKQERENIPNLDEFWVFVKRCFAQPRRTLRNNLQAYQYPLDRIASKLELRAQQIPPAELLALWHTLLS